MTITLDLPPETEASLLAQAVSRGLTLDAYLKAIIANQAAVSEAARPRQTLPREGDAVDRAIDEIFDTVELPPGMGRGVMRRENWYR